MWNKINNENDIKSFIDFVHNFHDSCVKEVKYSSGAYVDSDCSMVPVNSTRKLSIIIQSQYEEVKTIEMMFEGLNFLYLTPYDESFTCEIMNSILLFKDGNICWIDDDSFPDSFINYNGIIVSAKALFWRILHNSMGPSEHFISG